jgi:hypothetical protein
MSTQAAPLTAAVLGTQIIREASRFVGLREVKPNQNWDNPTTAGPDAALVLELRTLMRPTPWEPGWAYCAAFAEASVRAALIRLAITPKEADGFLKVMGPGVLASFNAFHERGLTVDKAEPGAIWFAQHGQSGEGHAGIVTGASAGGHLINTVEGNTSMDSKDPRADREGDWITTRTFDVTGRPPLHTRGFLPPSAILKLISTPH